MKILLTMNGSGSRFSKAGYETPKFLLSYNSKFVIEHIFDNIARNNTFDELVIGINISYSPYFSQLETLLCKYNFNWRLVIMNSLPGQACTAQKLVTDLHKESSDFSFWVMNCDTIVKSNWNESKNSDVIVEVFDSQLECYSYINTLQNVDMMAEKVVISNYASSGNYYFRSSQEFLKALKNSSYTTEMFISDVINTYISLGYLVNGLLIKAASVKTLGTPEQYESAVAESQVGS